MKMTSRANSLLVELLLVIMIFMLASVTLVELFGASKAKSNEAHAVNSAVLESQNLAEILYDSEDPEAALKEQGFTAEADGWVLKRDEYVLHVTQETEETDGGVLRTLTVRSEREEDVLATIPSTRYLPKEEAK